MLKLVCVCVGENVEPQEIEEAAMQSKLIQHIVVLGQDQRRLGAVIVANKDELCAAALEFKKAKGDNSEPSRNDMKESIRRELNK